MNRQPDGSDGSATAAVGLTEKIAALGGPGAEPGKPAKSIHFHRGLSVYRWRA